MIKVRIGTDLIDIRLNRLVPNDELQSWLDENGFSAEIVVEYVPLEDSQMKTLHLYLELPNEESARLYRLTFGE